MIPYIFSFIDLDHVRKDTGSTLENSQCWGFQKERVQEPPRVDQEGEDPLPSPHRCCSCQGCAAQTTLAERDPVLGSVANERLDQHFTFQVPSDPPWGLPVGPGPTMEDYVFWLLDGVQDLQQWSPSIFFQPSP